jgi:amino acid transporter
MANNKGLKLYGYLILIFLIVGNFIEGFIEGFTGTPPSFPYALISSAIVVIIAYVGFLKLSIIKEETKKLSVDKQPSKWVKWYFILAGVVSLLFVILGIVSYMIN